MTANGPTQPVSLPQAGVLTAIVWGLIYLGIAYLAWKNLVRVPDGAKLDEYVFVSSLVVNGVLPGVASKILKLDRNSEQSAQLEAHTHLVLMLVTCALLFVWGLGLCWKGMDLGHVPPLARVASLLYVVSGTIFIIWALVDQDFVGIAAYTERRCLPFVWPRVIMARISYVRLFLAAVTILIPFVHQAIAHSAPVLLPK